jgi:hypothetical protein
MTEESFSKFLEKVLKTLRHNLEFIECEVEFCVDEQLPNLLILENLVREMINTVKLMEATECMRNTPPASGFVTDYDLGYKLICCHEVMWGTLERFRSLADKMNLIYEIIENEYDYELIRLINNKRLDVRVPTTMSV